MIRREMVKEGFNLCLWSQCKKNKTNQKTKPKPKKPHMLQYKKICLNTLSAHNTNSEHCYHSTLLFPLLCTFQGLCLLSFWGKNIIFRPREAHI